MASQILNLPTYLSEDFLYLKNLKMFYCESMKTEDFESKLFNLLKSTKFIDFLPNHDDPEWVDFNKLDLIKKIHPKLILDDLLSKF